MDVWYARRESVAWHVISIGAANLSSEEANARAPKQSGRCESMLGGKGGVSGSCYPGKFLKEFRAFYGVFSTNFVSCSFDLSPLYVVHMFYLDNYQL